MFYFVSFFYFKYNKKNIVHWPAQAGMYLFDILGYNQIPYFQLPAAILTGYIMIFAFSRLIHKVARFFRINM